MLAKVRHFVTPQTLRNIYFGIFSSILTYGSQVWGQYINQHILRLVKIQNKAIRIITFANFHENTTPLYNKSKILKLSDHIKLENIVYIHNSLRGNLPIPLRDSFHLAENSYCTRGSLMHKLVLPKARTLYGLNSINYQSVAAWNYILSVVPISKVHCVSKNVCKKT